MRRVLLPAVGATLLLAAGAVALASTTAANRRSATREAPRLLARIQLPAGAVASSADPSVGGLLAHAPSRPGTANLVDVHRFWVVPGDPQRVLTWFDGHPPAGSQSNMGGASGTPHGIATAWTGFWFGPASSTLADRELIVTVARARSGGTAVRGGVSFRLRDRRAPPLTGGPTLIKELQLLLHTSLGLT